MQYSEARFEIVGAEYVRDMLTADLAEIGFDSFENSDSNGLFLSAYIQIKDFNEDTLRGLLSLPQYNNVVKLQETLLCEDKDWNEEWEKNYFQPILIRSRATNLTAIIHSPFHKDYEQCDYDIVINPRMAFGTGHHQTTSMILSYLLDNLIYGKRVLDMGCGTGVLGILAMKLGAKSLTAIDIDNWCVENTLENIGLNIQQNPDNIEVLHGDSRLLEGRKFDIILANINRNILLMDMERYIACLDKGGLLCISGFYEDDVNVLYDRASSLGMVLDFKIAKDDWAMMSLQKL